MKTSWFKFCFICMAMAILWTGCSRLTGSKTPENSPSITLTALETTITLTVQPPTPTRMISPTALRPTLTYTPRPSITPSPFPTLSQSERQQYLEEHLPTNNNCRLPCWLGITPGKTLWNEARTFLTYLGIRMGEIPEENDQILHIFGGFDFEEPTIYQRFSMLEQSEKVKSMFLNVDGYNAPNEFSKVWKLYDPRNLLRNYGTPSKVWFATQSQSWGDRHGYHLIIAYDNQGIIVWYQGFLNQIGTNFQVCPRFEERKDITGIEVYLQAPSDPQPVEELGGIGDWQFLFDRSKRIVEASGLSEEQFYELFTQNNQPACFDTPIDIWPQFFNP